MEREIPLLRFDLSLYERTNERTAKRRRRRNKKKERRSGRGGGDAGVVPFVL